MAFTGTSRNSFTSNPPTIILQVNDEVGKIALPTPTGNEFSPGKGDLWRVDISNFKFTDTCVTKGDVSKITLEETGNDGWLVDSIVTFLRSDGAFILLSVDIDVNRWIDGNGGTELEQFSLTIV